MRLNLPESALKIKKTTRGLSVYDLLRKRYVSLTPEEWVRQYFVHYLIEHKGYPAGLMGNEVSLEQNGIKRRCDTVVGDHTGRPLVIIEYKAPTVTLSQRAFDQIARYNMVLHARYLMVSNGLSHYCCRMDYARDRYDFLAEIPSYPDLQTE